MSTGIGELVLTWLLLNESGYAPLIVSLGEVKVTVSDVSECVLIG